MKCPECGEDGSAVTRTMDVGDTILRKRLCACGVTWRTKERVERASVALMALLHTGGSGGIDLPSDSSPVPSGNPDQTRPRSEPRAKSPYSDEFEACWKPYGRKEEKVKAFARWKIEAKTVGGEVALRDLVLAALTWQAPVWERDGWRFAKYFERYLKARKWEDEPLPTFTGNRRPASRGAATVENIGNWLSKGADK